MAVKYVMRYTIYTTVDVTSTGQYRSEPGKETERYKEQNFQTILQTLGMRGNVSFQEKPKILNSPGSLIGFNTKNIISIWIFNFETEKEHLFGTTEDPVAFLKEDFDGVPFIAGLDECMEQNFNVFVTDGPSKNIIFHAHN